MVAASTFSDTPYRRGCRGSHSQKKKERVTRIDELLEQHNQIRACCRHLSVRLCLSKYGQTCSWPLSQPDSLGMIIPCSSSLRSDICIGHKVSRPDSIFSMAQSTTYQEPGIESEKGGLVTATPTFLEYPGARFKLVLVKVALGKGVGVLFLQLVLVRLVATWPGRAVERVVARLPMYVCGSAFDRDVLVGNVADVCQRREREARWHEATRRVCGRTASLKPECWSRVFRKVRERAQWTLDGGRGCLSRWRARDALQQLECPAGGSDQAALCQLASSRTQNSPSLRRSQVRKVAINIVD